MFKTEGGFLDTTHSDIEEQFQTMKKCIEKQDMKALKLFYEN